MTINFASRCCAVLMVLVFSTSVNAQGVNKLAEMLYVPQYTTMRTAMSKLEELANIGDAEARPMARDALENYHRRGKAWLMSMGNLESDIDKGSIVGLAVHAPDMRLDSKLLALIYGRNAKTLVFTGKGITDECIEAISGMPVESITLIDTSVTEKAFAGVDLSLLEILHLNDCKIQNLELSQKALPSLAMLDVHGTDVANEFLTATELIDLQYLNVQRTKIDANGMLAIGRFSKLADLRLDYDDLSADALKIIKGKLALQRIRILCRNDQEAADALERCKSELVKCMVTINRD